MHHLPAFLIWMFLKGVSEYLKFPDRLIMMLNFPNRRSDHNPSFLYKQGLKLDDLSYKPKRNFLSSSYWSPFIYGLIFLTFLITLIRLIMEPDEIKALAVALHTCSLLIPDPTKATDESLDALKDRLSKV